MRLNWIGWTLLVLIGVLSGAILPFFTSTAQRGPRDATTRALLEICHAVNQASRTGSNVNGSTNLQDLDGVVIPGHTNEEGQRPFSASGVLKGLGSRLVFTPKYLVLAPGISKESIIIAHVADDGDGRLVHVLYANCAIQMRRADEVEQAIAKLDEALQHHPQTAPPR